MISLITSRLLNYSSAPHTIRFLTRRHVLVLVNYACPATASHIAMPITAPSPCIAHYIWRLRIFTANYRIYDGYCISRSGLLQVCNYICVDAVCTARWARGDPLVLGLARFKPLASELLTDRFVLPKPHLSSLCSPRLAGQVRRIGYRRICLVATTSLVAVLLQHNLLALH